MNKQQYKTYLLTPHWLSLRDKIKHKANHKCEACSSNQSLQVHHLTYERLGQESIDDLMCLCEAYHNLVHSLIGKESTRKEIVEFVRHAGSFKVEKETVRSKYVLPSFYEDRIPKKSKKQRAIEMKEFFDLLKSRGLKLPQSNHRR